MGTININFNVSRKDAGLLISSLDNLIRHTGNQTVRKKLELILNEMKFDYWKDDKINSFVVSGLIPVATGRIYLNSHLRNQLSIDDGWLKHSLYLLCNDIIKRLIKISNTSKQVKAITPPEAYKCKTVKDIVELIRKRYDDAK